jgi:hypothetical protein
MTDTQQQPEDLSEETLRNALKAFKKRLKLTALDDDSRLGRGPFSGGAGANSATADTGCTNCQKESTAGQVESG